MEAPKRQRPSEVEVSQEFSAIIKKPKNGAPAIVVNSRAFYEHQLKKFNDGERVTLIITNRWPKRTNQQNRYWWGAVLPMVAQETGEEDLERLHELFKAKFLTTEIVEVLGHKIRMTKSTTELTTKQFSEFVTRVCREVNCVPPPAENWGLERI